MADLARRIIRQDHPDAPTSAARTATPVKIGGAVVGYRAGKKKKLTGPQGRAARRQHDLAQLNVWRRANGVVSEPVGFLIVASNTWRMLRGAAEPMADLVRRHGLEATQEDIARAEAYPIREDRLLSAREAGELLQVTKDELEAILIDANFALTLWAKDEGDVSRAERRARRRREMSRERKRRSRAKEKLAKSVTQTVTFNSSKVTDHVTPLILYNINRDPRVTSSFDHRPGATSAILEALAQGHETAEAIADAADVRLASTKTLLGRLVRRGQAARTSRGRYTLAITAPMGTENEQR